MQEPIGNQAELKMFEPKPVEGLDGERAGAMKGRCLRLLGLKFCLQPLLAGILETVFNLSRALVISFFNMGIMIEALHWFIAKIISDNMHDEEKAVNKH